ncbi:MAG TPA: helix-turn-helix domain-containing protein [Bacillota bacterium]|nr:helix-turn-helix domain-containing protein [Bacillota bacterium]
MKSIVKFNNNQDFYPFQPEIKHIMDHYIEYKPKHAFNNNIALYYQFHVPTNNIRSFSLIPDGCFDIVFCCDIENQSASLWTSPIVRSEQLELKRGCKYFGVRFLPEQNIFTFNKPMKELLDQQIPLQTAVTITPNTIEAIAHATSFEQRIIIFDEQLIKYTKRSTKQTILKYCVNQIYKYKGGLSINVLIENTGFSDRYIRHLFNKYIGFSPKQFSQIVRFQNTLTMILKNRPPAMLEVIYANGFYDQAHFINNFKNFTQLSPARYRNTLLEQTKTN